MEFEQLKIVYDNCPIVLIDCSGSTSSNMFLRKKVLSNNSQPTNPNINPESDSDTDTDSDFEEQEFQTKQINVLDYQLEVAKKHFESIGISSVYLMFWNSSLSIYSMEPTTVSSLDTIKKSPAGGTNLKPALKGIPQNWMENKSTCDIYIYTDGEISDGKSAGEQIKKLFESNVRIYITTVEPNNSNYVNGDCQAGNSIYEAIQSNNLMGRVKKFSSYNKKYVGEPFVSFDNPDVGPSYAPFRGKCFRVDKTWEFVNHLENVIKEESVSDDQLLKLAHELTMTLYYLTKDRSLIMKHQIVNMFSDLFSSYSVYRDVRKLFLEEIDNHSKGKSTTFQAYKNNREKMFEQAQLSLYSNVKKSICHKPNSNFISFITSTEDPSNPDFVIKASDESVCENITLSDKTYSNSAVKINSGSSPYHIPMLPTSITLDHDMYDQCIRQWIRANYGKKYKLNPASDFIQYYVLGDVLRVVLSEVSEETKQAYMSIASVMMDRKRFGTDTTEYTYLLSNPPAPVTNITDDKINWIFNRAMFHCKMTKMIQIQNDDGTSYEKKAPNCEPMTWWYAFVKCLGDHVLAKAQLPYCLEDMKKDNVTDDNILDWVKSKMQPIKEYTHSANAKTWEYLCYITWEDTSGTGGWTVPAHQINSKYVCSPKFVLSEQAYQSMATESHIKCPICYKPLESNTFVKVKSFQELENEANQKQQQVMPSLNEPYYNSSSFEKVEIIPEMYCKEGPSDNKLKFMDSCSFDSVAYTIQKPYFQEAIGSRSIEVRTQEEFNNSVTHRYPFLNKLDWTGVCLAGGFCRSILLRQRLKDLDFFLYGENHETNFSRVLKQILTLFKESDDKMKFLIMYKHQFNVFEVVCVHDPNDFFKDHYRLDNFKNYDFKSLHRFDQYTIIEPETGKVYRKRNKRGREMEVDEDSQIMKDLESRDFSNYFEDGDVSGVRMKYRLQFVLTRNKSIENIFDNFDMYPCRVAWDGKTTWFTSKSELAYKYMMNVVNEHNYSTLLEHRLSKYFTYGFSIVMPELDLNQLGGSYFAIGDLKFNIIQVNQNQILVEHNSNIAEKLESIEKLEKKNLESGKSLYKSSLFCSLVSLLRYVKINDIAYKFTDQVNVPDEQGSMSFEEADETVQFIDKIDSRIEDHDWYGYYRINK
jgi:hypothetical protein